MSRRLTYRHSSKLVFSVLLLLGVIVALVSSCTEQFARESPYSALEVRIRSENDWRANFTWAEYRQLMDVLSDKKFRVTDIDEFRNTFDSGVVVVGLRHDIDVHPFKALEMADIERHYNFRATYYVLATAEYYGTITSAGVTRFPEMDYVYHELVDRGANIGIHNDLLTIMIQYHLDPLLFNLGEIAHYDSIGIHIVGTAAHGSEIAKATGTSNFEMFSDFARKDSVRYMESSYPIGSYSLREYGFEYEAYHVPYNLYFSESGGAWKDPNGFAGVIEKIKASKPGDRIQILTHPVWWGKDEPKPIQSKSKK
jgi:hypothetical protein